MVQASLPSSPITLLMQRYQASGLDPEYRVRRVEGADHSIVSFSVRSLSLFCGCEYILWVVLKVRRPLQWNSLGRAS